MRERKRDLLVAVATELPHETIKCSEIHSKTTMFQWTRILLSIKIKAMYVQLS